MRIHHLEVAAFGPFAHRQTIDFDELSAAGLFLLNGETGAGKTSILDAICYALYAGLPGAREGSKALRSDHAGPADAPEVRLDFSTGGRRFEVTRSPQWQRPSKRGAGKTTTAQAQSRLRELVDGQWREVSTRNDEVAAELREVIGLGKDEFTKVAMLPQGAFAAFLRAKDKEREDLLKTLFDTRLYGSVESLLADEFTAARTAAAEAERSRQTAITQLVEDAATSLYDGETPLPAELAAGDAAADQAPAEAVDTARLLPLLAIRLEERTAALDAERTAAEAAATTARTTATSLAAAADRHRALAELEALRASHTAKATHIADAEARLALDARATAISAAEAGRRRTAQAVDAAETAWEAAERGTADGLAAAYLEQASVSGDSAAPAHRAGDAASRATGDAAVLAAALPDERELADRTAELARAGAEHERRSADLAERQKEQETLEASLPGLRDQAEALAGTANTLPSLTAERDAAARRVEAVAARAAADTAASQAHEAWAAAKDRQLADRERLLDLGRTRVAQAAAWLARELVPGAACLVCGATEHPAPATLIEGDLVEEEDEEAARSTAQASEAAENRAAESLRRAREAASLAAGQAGEYTAEQAQDALEAAATALADATTSAERAQKARSTLDQAVEDSELLRAANTAEATSLSAVAARIEQLHTGITALESRLQQLRGDDGSLQARHDRIVEARQALETLAAAARTFDEARGVADTAARSWQEERTAAGFPDDEAWTGALLDVDARAAARQDVAAHTAEGVRIETLAGTEAVTAAAAEAAQGIGAPAQEALEAAGAAATETAATRDAVLQRGAVLQAYAARFERRRADLRRLEEEQGAVLDRFETVKSMADAARGMGENRFKMTLSTYVLAARLEAVAAAATERLLVMSGERYSLVHDDSPKGNAKSGLGLHVLDAWTGHRRDTQTLSGGESFMASLALALGLADVIQQQSGGIDIETLFVDEGFGSLDEGALEMVMDALDGLRRGGRVVGLVSHVADMKQRIPAQLRVRKERTGSTARVVMADAVE
ncbi:AAA family ATPase [Arthrobacter sp. JSM 101049]|uniref:AAA family ATPase n=1 Tax=Arthrobacter sp. JSM 101049 TaxID=929097 RepID=UPI0035645167